MGDSGLSCFFLVARDPQMVGHSFYSSLHPTMWGSSFPASAAKHYSNGFIAPYPPAPPAPPSSQPGVKEIKSEQQLQQEHQSDIDYCQQQVATTPSDANLSPSSNSSSTAPSPPAASGATSNGYITKRPPEGSGTYDTEAASAEPLLAVASTATTSASSSSSSVSSSSTAYPYFTTPSCQPHPDLSSPLYGSYSTTGVFGSSSSGSGGIGSKLVHNGAKQKAKSKSNAGKSKIVTPTTLHTFFCFLFSFFIHSENGPLTRSYMSYGSLFVPSSL